MTDTPRINRLAWATDVHLNFLSMNELDDFCDELRHARADAILFTGDIAEAPSLKELLEATVRRVRLPIYFVLGNHDYYYGGIEKVRALASELSQHSAFLHWLPAVGVVELTPDVALVGHDGWADGRLGDYETSRVTLNDYVLIDDLVAFDKDERLEAIGKLGDEAATYFKEILPVALSRYPRVIAATHVPPFKEACWHAGKIANDEWLPYFSCKATGDALRAVMEQYPHRRLEVLCGHTHGAGTAEILPNLLVRTGGAEYGAPVVQAVLELSTPV